MGEHQSYSIELTNTGKKKIAIVSKAKRGREFAFGHFPLPIVIRAGESVQLPVLFVPGEAGPAQGTMEIGSTAENSQLILQLWGTGEASKGPHLEISPKSLNFGNVTVGSSATLSAALTAANGPVTISSDRTNSSEFVISGVTLPITIPEGKSIPVKIKFTPTSSGTDPAKVGFISDAVNSPSIEDVTGTGIAQGSYSVSLSWNSVKAAVGYNVFRGTAQSGPFQEINSALESSTNFTDNTVAAGATYYYVTTAVNSEGEQSSYSNVTEAVIPN
jgi:hypothetical protein